MKWRHRSASRTEDRQIIALVDQGYFQSSKNSNTGETKLNQTKNMEDICVRSFVVFGFLCGFFGFGLCQLRPAYLGLAPAQIPPHELAGIDLFLDALIQYAYWCIIIALGLPLFKMDLIQSLFTWLKIKSCHLTSYSTSHCLSQCLFLPLINLYLRFSYMASSPLIYEPFGKSLKISSEFSLLFTVQISELLIPLNADGSLNLS